MILHQSRNGRILEEDRRVGGSVFDTTTSLVR
jgi:hypothetical protein